MEEKTMLKIVDIKDLAGIFLKRIWIMIFAGIIAASTFFVVNTITSEPEYSSTATLYILGQNDGDSSVSEINTQISIATKIVNDCTYMIKSHIVLDHVIDTLGIGESVTYAELKQKISTNNPMDTRILEVTVRASSPEEAKMIVDAICVKAKMEISRTVGFEQINIFEEGVYDPTPCNKTGAMTYIFIAVIAAILVYVVFFAIFILDDSVWTDEEIDKYLGLSVIGDIPDANSTHKKHYGGKYSAYGAYGYNAKEENSYKANRGEK